MRGTAADMSGFGIPAGAVAGRGQLVLTVNTFGLPRTARFGMLDRRLRPARLEELTEAEVYETVRGAVHAARMAAGGGDDRDMKIALQKIQRAAAELVRRSTGRPILLEVDARDTPAEYLGVADKI